MQCLDLFAAVLVVSAETWTLPPLPELRIQDSGAPGFLMEPPSILLPRLVTVKRCWPDRGQGFHGCLIAGRRNS